MERMGDPNTDDDDSSPHQLKPGIAQCSLAVRRGGLILRTLCVVGMDLAVALAVSIACYSTFVHAPAPGGAKLAVSLVCLPVCMLACFLERGLYAAAAINGQHPDWKNIVFAWIQTVALTILVVSALAAFCGSTARLQTALAQPLIGAGVLAWLLTGCAGVAVARALVARVKLGIVLLNRTVIIGDATSIQDLTARIRAAEPARFDIVSLFQMETDGGAEALAPPAPHELQALEQMIRDDAVDTVLVALPASKERLAEAMVQRLSMAPVDVFLYLTPAPPRPAAELSPIGVKTAAPVTPASWPGLARPSTTFPVAAPPVEDNRHRAGHDVVGTTSPQPS
jgi:FlaA1/EpsC-like NDP-sugar epimerase